MSYDLVFRGSLAVVGILLIVVRMNYAIKVASTKVSTKKEGNLSTLWILNSLGTTASIVYVLAPDWMNWSTLGMPVQLRWTGLALGLITVILFTWVHRALGKNWSISVVIKEQHTLVTRGPYHWVRHPMYTTLFIWASAFFLLSSNWFIGISWLALSIVSSSRVSREETLLLERFGDEYKEYMRRTGQFLPRLQRGGSGAK